MTGPFGTGGFGATPFSTSPLFNTKTLIDAILRDTNHSSPASETNKRAIVLGFLNNRYARVSSSRHWDWLNADVDFSFTGSYDTGTVTVTQGSEIVTGAGTVFNATMIPYSKIIVGDYINSIAKVNAPLGLELEGEWNGDTQASAKFEVVTPIYALPADCEHVKSMLVDGVGEMIPLGVQEFRRKQQYQPTITGAPRYYTEIARRAEDGIRLIEVFPAPDRKYNVHLNYSVNLMALTDSEDSFPLIPDRHRVVLYYGALAEMYRFLRDAPNAQAAELDFARTLGAMQSDNQLTDSRLIFQPARDYRNRRRSRRYRTFMDRSDFSRYE